MCLDTGIPCCYHAYNTIYNEHTIGYSVEEWSVCCFCGDIKMTFSYTDRIPTLNHGKYEPETSSTTHYFPDKDLENVQI